MLLPDKFDVADENALELVILNSLHKSAVCSPALFWETVVKDDVDMLTGDTLLFYSDYFYLANNAGETPLMYALGNKCYKVLPYLAEHTLKLNIRNKKNLNLFHYLAMAKDISPEILEQLQTSNRLSFQNITQEMACSINIKWHDAHFPTINQYTCCPLTAAVVEDNVTFLQFVHTKLSIPLQRQPDINNNFTLLHLAIIFNSQDCFNYLLTQPKSINPTLIVTLPESQVSLVSTLLLAIILKKEDMALQLLKAGANPASNMWIKWQSVTNHETSWTENAPVYYFANKYINSAMLLEWFKPLILKDKDLVFSRSLVFRAIKNDYLDNLNFLLKLNCFDLNYLDVYEGGYGGRRKSVLHIAVIKGAIPIIKILLEHGANPNVPDSNGYTPVHEAVFSKNIPILALLLDAGGKLDKIGGKGFFSSGISPGALATKHGLTPVNEFIKKYTQPQSEADASSCSSCNNAL